MCIVFFVLLVDYLIYRRLLRINLNVSRVCWQKTCRLTYNHF